jgi:hypothetical protein
MIVRGHESQSPDSGKHPPRRRGGPSKIRRWGPEDYRHSKLFEAPTIVPQHMQTQKVAASSKGKPYRTERDASRSRVPRRASGLGCSSALPLFRSILFSTLLDVLSLSSLPRLTPADPPCASRMCMTRLCISQSRCVRIRTGGRIRMGVFVSAPYPQSVAPRSRQHPRSRQRGLHRAPWHLKVAAVVAQ